MSCLSDRSGGGIWVKWPKKPRNGSISENNDGLQVGVAASRLQKKILRLKTKSSSSSGLSSRLRKRMFNKTMLLKLGETAQVNSANFKGLHKLLYIWYCYTFDPVFEPQEAPILGQVQVYSSLCRAHQFKFFSCYRVSFLPFNPFAKLFCNLEIYVRLEYSFFLWCGLL